MRPRELVALASSAGIATTEEPSEEGKANLDKLEGLSGAAFGEYGEGYIRFSYANSYENLMEAVQLIKTAVANRVTVGSR